MTREPRFNESFVADADFTDPGTRTWPDELLAQRQWMGHVDKHPFAPWGDPDAPAECNNPECPAVRADEPDCECDARFKWSHVPLYRTGDQVLSVLPIGEIDGLAFIQRHDDPYAFVDGDDIRCPETGEVHPAFLAVLAVLGATYTDVSTSGSGVHANYRGSLPGGVKEAKLVIDDEPWGANDDLPAVEIYGNKHVCVATGRHVPGTPVTVNEWDVIALEAILDATGNLSEKTGNESGRPPLPNRNEPDRSYLPDGVTDDMQDVYDAIDELDAQRVADRTIVREWTDPSGATNRAFLPTWGSSDDRGTANFVNENLWKDSGHLGGYGGPVVMAAIDLGLVAPRNAKPGCVNGRDWHTAVEHLRDLGFDVPEYDSEAAERDDEHGYDAVVDEHAAPGTNPFLDDEAYLVACVTARENGAVPEEVDVPDRALRPIVQHVTGVSPGSDAVGEESWVLARDVFDALDTEEALDRFGPSEPVAINGGEQA